MTEKKFSFRIVQIVAVIAAIVFAVIWFRQDSVIIDDLAFIDIDGQAHQIAEYRGKPVLVVFWATDCPGCVQEMPELVELYKEYAPAGLGMISIAMPHDTPEHIQAMRAEKDLPYTITWDRDAAISSVFGNVRVTPTHFLLGSDGKIVMRKIGTMDFNALKAKLHSMGINPA
jgi:peroxiredoxin